VSFIVGVVLLLAAGEPATVFAHQNLGHEPVRALAFDKSGATLATSRGGGIELVDVAARATRSTIGGRGSRNVMSLAFSPDGTLLAGGGPGADVTLWDPKSGAVVRKLEGHGAGRDLGRLFVRRQEARQLRFQRHGARVRRRHRRAGRGLRPVESRHRDHARALQPRRRADRHRRRRQARHHRLLQADGSPLRRLQGHEAPS